MCAGHGSGLLGPQTQLLAAVAQLLAVAQLFAAVRQSQAELALKSQVIH